MSLTVGLPDRSAICLWGFSFRPINPINLFFSLANLPWVALLLCIATAWGSSSLADERKHAFWQPGQKTGWWPAVAQSGGCWPGWEFENLNPVGILDPASNGSEESLNHPHAQGPSQCPLQCVSTSPLFSCLRLWVWEPVLLVADSLVSRTSLCACLLVHLI